jgi:hypothetical protein
MQRQILNIEVRIITVVFTRRSSVRSGVRLLLLGPGRFLVTMRLTVLRQMTRSLPPQPADGDEDDDAPFTTDPGQGDRDLERVKHFLWHGNTFRALQILGRPSRRLRDHLRRPGRRRQAACLLGVPVVLTKDPTDMPLTAPGAMLDRVFVRTVHPSAQILLGR